MIDSIQDKHLSKQDDAADLKSHFFDLSLDLLCILDLQGCIQDANRAFLALLGKKLAQVQNHPFVNFVDADDHPAITAVLTAELPLSFVCHHHAFDGMVKWYLWTFYPSAPDFIHAVGRDITPYRDMEIKELERNIFAEALLDTVLAINSSLALDQVLDRILSNVGKIVTYEYVSILLVEAGQAKVAGMQHRTQRRTIISTKGEKFSIGGNSYLRTMFETRESLIIPEMEHAPSWILESVPAVSGAFLGAPIIVEDEVIGFLCVFNTRKEFFAPLHAQQLIMFANQAGIAINNARLYEQAQSAAVLRERQRMAQELHDSVNQDLFAASTYADLLPRAIGRKPEVVARYTSDISRLIRGAVAQMRMILVELHPDTLTTTGLAVLIQQLCDVFTRQTGVSVDFRASNKQTVLEEPMQVAVYRIVQEALHNINKHANATQVKVILRLTEWQLCLIIEDNGAGFDQAAITEMQFGLSGMQERAQSIHADLLIDSKIGQGTKISLRKKFYGEHKTYSHYASG